MSCLKADVLLLKVKLNVCNPTKTSDKSPFLCVLAFSHIHAYFYVYINVYAYVCEFVYVYVFLLGFMKEGEYQLCLLSGGSDKVLQTKFALH